jgi:hypothetical protein
MSVHTIGGMFEGLDPKPMIFQSCSAFPMGQVGTPHLFPDPKMVFSDVSSTHNYKCIMILGGKKKHSLEAAGQLKFNSPKPGDICKKGSPR